MFGWFKSSKKHPIRVSSEHLKIIFVSGDYMFVPSKELSLWLLDYKDKYDFFYDEMTGDLRIDFKDHKTAVLCKLSFA